MISDMMIKSVIQSLKRIPIDIYGDNTLLDYDLGFSNSDKERLIDTLIIDLGVDLNYSDANRLRSVGDVIKLVNKRI